MVTAQTISVLIVEDVAEMQTLLKHILQGIDGIKVSGLAKNTAEARLEMMRRRPDLILLDEILPGESSFELIKESHLQGIGVILITGLEEATHPIPENVLGRVEKPSWDTVQEDQNRIKNYIFSRLKMAGD